ncbi:MAG: site-specific DNA-methyltransferase, partial [Bacillota bacterium]|nr:site-specific DNA-methyltransferase [Bacillota bacterium]
KRALIQYYQCFQRILSQINVVQYVFDLVTFCSRINYLYGKLKLDSFEKYISFVYPYILEKTTYLYSEKDFDNYVFENAASVVRETEISDTGAGRDIVELKYKSLEDPDNKVFKLLRDAPLDDVYILNGKQLSFYSKNIKRIGDQLTATKLLTNIWTDISWEGIAKEGGVNFKKGKKPEQLIRRIIDLATKKDDWVLDSFLGSGTTTAVSHKMGRRWIGIEMADHCYSHCLKRMVNIVEGSDQNGVSKIENWQGGGGFKFYELADALLTRNEKLPVYSINPSYTFDMLAEALCKIEGFSYQPKGKYQGQSSENRFIHITMEFVNNKYIYSLMTELAENQSLLIYCTRMQSAITLPEKVEIKNIPRDLLKKYDFESEVR